MLKTLEPMPSDRKCYRLIGGVLVQQTVADVRPAVEGNAQNLKQVMIRRNATHAVNKLSARW